MSVYVDDYFAPFGRMKMCHMVADTHSELVGMAWRIGVDTKFIQHPWTSQEHFDICLSKRNKAIALGAIPITFMQLGKFIVKRRKTGISA